MSKEPRLGKVKTDKRIITCMGIIIASLLLVAIFGVEYKTIPSKATAKTETRNFGNILVSEENGYVDCASVARAEMGNIDNRFYIAIDTPDYTTPRNHIYDILGILACFKYNHQDLEVARWEIDKQQHSYNRRDRVFGIWIDCIPRSKR